MNPDKVQKARRIIGKPWYNRYRAWKMHKLFEHWDTVLLHSRKVDGHALKMLMRYAKKEGYYINKTHSK